MSNVVKPFPLNFDDDYWRIEEAVPFIFFGDLALNKQESEEIVKYVSNEIEEGSLLKERGNQFRLIEPLQQYLIRLVPERSIIDRKMSYSPLVWCRIAVQFWLTYGGRQKKFTLAMTQWIKNKNKLGRGFVFYDSKPDNVGGRSKNKMPLEIFFFDNIDINDTVDKNYRLKSVKPKVATPQIKPPKSSKRSIENSIGKNVLDFVKDLVWEAAKDRSIRNLRRRPDPDTQRYRYTGSRSDLYDVLCAIDPQCEKYAKTVIFKAISQVATCRKYWSKA